MVCIYWVLLSELVNIIHVNLCFKKSGHGPMKRLGNKTKLSDSQNICNTVGFNQSYILIRWLILVKVFLRFFVLLT
jgi:hypothetical protein